MYPHVISIVFQVLLTSNTQNNYHAATLNTWYVARIQWNNYRQCMMPEKWHGVMDRTVRDIVCIRDRPLVSWLPTLISTSKGL